MIGIARRAYKLYRDLSTKMHPALLGMNAVLLDYIEHARGCLEDCVPVAKPDIPSPLTNLGEETNPPPTRTTKRTRGSDITSNETSKTPRLSLLPQVANSDDIKRVVTEVYNSNRAAVEALQIIQQKVQGDTRHPHSSHGHSRYPPGAEACHCSRGLRSHLQPAPSRVARTTVLQYVEACLHGTCTGQACDVFTSELPQHPPALLSVSVLLDYLPHLERHQAEGEAGPPQDERDDLPQKPPAWPSWCWGVTPPVPWCMRTTRLETQRQTTATCKF